jgi:hypothetical protein
VNAIIQINARARGDKTVADALDSRLRTIEQQSSLMNRAGAGDLAERVRIMLDAGLQ